MTFRPTGRAIYGRCARASGKADGGVPGGQRTSGRRTVTCGCCIEAEAEVVVGAGTHPHGTYVSLTKDYT